MKGGNRKMKNKLPFVLIAVALLSTMFVEVSSAESANNIGGISPFQIGKTYYVTFRVEGEYEHFSSVLYLKDRDTYNMTLENDLTITVIVADCCLMGDKIAIFYPNPTTILFEVTSPKIIIGTAKLKAGTYTFYVGYTYSTTGTLMGYDLWLIATHP